jgi:uncharacterized protein
VRILAIADTVSPFVYSERFPATVPEFDVVLSAGDMPGHVLEFLATKLRTPPVYVIGNHGNAYIRTDEEPDAERLPGGCVNAHRRVVEVGGLLVAGVEGSARYRPGPHQYSELGMRRHVLALVPQLLLRRWRHGRAADVLLTHAPPEGPHAGSDYAHRGVGAFNDFHRRWRPLVHVHGHVHLSGANAPRSYVSPEGVMVVNAYGFTVIDLQPLRAERAAERAAAGAAGRAPRH